MPLSIVSRKVAWIVKIEGRFGAGRMPSIESVIPNDKKYKVLAFDMSRAESIESSALSFLLQILNFCEKAGLEMVLIDVPDPIMEILKLATLDQFFTILSMNKFEKLYQD